MWDMNPDRSVDVDERMLAYMRANSGHVSFVVRGQPAERVASALEVARRRVAGIRHPDEPDEQFASFISGVEALDEGGWSFWVDMADAEAYEGILELALDCVVSALEEAAVESVNVSFPQGSWVDDHPGGPSAEVSAPEVTPAERPAGFPLPPSSRLIADTTLGGRRVSEFLVHEPIENLLAFYRSALEAEGYVIEAVTEDCPPDMFKARHFVGFHEGDVRGALLLTEWLEPSPTLGFGDVRIDTWKDGTA
jgi:hypothetical protein